MHTHPRLRTLLSIAAFLFSASALAADAPPATPPADAERHDSGLISRVLVEGNGATPEQADDIVMLRYSGWTSSGIRFDTTVGNRPAALALSSGIPGWQEGIARMRTGETRRMWIPETLAFGGMTGRPGGTVIYDVELLRVIQNPPPDVHRAPAEASRSETGVAWMVLEEGEGETPSFEAVATLHLTSWDRTGKLIESTHFLGRPQKALVRASFLSFQEMLPQMRAGERRRIWAPDGLAYPPFTKKPLGDMVFDLELISFVEPEEED